jgi:hypothetical protein
MIAGIKEAGGEAGADVAAGAGNEDKALLICDHGAYLSKLRLGLTSL